MHSSWFIYCFWNYPYRHCWRWIFGRLRVRVCADNGSVLGGNTKDHRSWTCPKHTGTHLSHTYHYLNDIIFGCLLRTQTLRMAPIKPSFDWLVEPYVMVLRNIHTQLHIHMCTITHTCMYTQMNTLLLLTPETSRCDTRCSIWLITSQSFENDEGKKRLCTHEAAHRTSSAVIALFFIEGTL